MQILFLIFMEKRNITKTSFIHHNKPTRQKRDKKKTSNCHLLVRKDFNNMDLEEQKKEKQIKNFLEKNLIDSNKINKQVFNITTYKKGEYKKDYIERENKERFLKKFLDKEFFKKMYRKMNKAEQREIRKYLKINNIDYLDYKKQ